MTTATGRDQGPPDPDDVVVTPRLRLEPFDGELVEALNRSLAEAARVGRFRYPRSWTAADGANFRPPSTDWRWIRLGWVFDDPTVARWIDRLVLDRDRHLLGRVGFHQPPHDGAVEFAWWTAEAARGTGVATEAARALIEWAASRGVERVIASIAPDNAPSLRVARRLGFERTGEAIDPHDGLEWIFERPAHLGS